MVATTRSFIAEHDYAHEAEFNARLIAAAPELLQALEYVRDFGGRGEIEGGPHHGMSVSYFVEKAIDRTKEPTP